LWALPKAAPALLRHLVAYVDLLGLDLSRAHRQVIADFLASAVTVVCGAISAFMGCLLVIALTWDTPYRVSAIAWMAGGFLAAAIAAAAYRSKLARKSPPFLAAVRREWQEDRILLERILASRNEE
jgi:uncharacterized membrane protein YqjE